MGLFGKKKNCDICGGKIGLMGNRKLSDGNMCKDCAKKISPYLTGRKQHSVAEMNDHLAYRAKNEEKLEKFSPTRTIGTDAKLYIDDKSGQWLVSRKSRYKEDNPDVLTFDQVTGAAVVIDESKTEIKRELPDGKKESYSPPRYESSYDFRIDINVNNPWFSEISFRVNNSSIKGRTSVDYRNAQQQAEQIKQALTEVHKEVLETAAQAAAPKASIRCPFCGAVVTPDASGKCPFCDSGLNV